MTIQNSNEFEIEVSKAAWLAAGDLRKDAEGCVRSRVELPVARSAGWLDLFELQVTAATARQARLSAMDRNGRARNTFDALRTNVLQELRRNNWTSVAVTAPRSGCGTSTVALNLAFSLQRQEDCHTVLLDLDLRSPSLASALGVKEGWRIARLLRGESSPGGALARYGRNLALGLNTQPVERSSELLQNALTPTALARMRQALSPDVVLYDLPPMLGRDDVTAFLPNVDCALLVVKAEHTSLEAIDASERRLAERTNVLGVVLNQCRFLPDEDGD